MMPFRNYVGFPLTESCRYVLQLAMSLNLDPPQALIRDEHASGWTFTRENQQTVSFVTP